MKGKIVKHIVRDDDQFLAGDVRKKRFNELLVKNSRGFVELLSLA